MHLPTLERGDNEQPWFKVGVDHNAGSKSLAKSSGSETLVVKSVARKEPRRGLDSGVVFDCRPWVRSAQRGR